MKVSTVEATGSRPNKRHPVEKHFGDLLRSDHSPFWAAGMPALMWTDTSEFRNPNYHQPTDTPDTLDYDALAEVTRMIVGHMLLSQRRR